MIEFSDYETLSKPYKIVFLLPNLEGGGAERVTLNIINQLDRSVFEIYLVVGILKGDLINFIPNDIITIDLHSSKTILTLIPFIRTTKKIAPDIVFSTLNRTNVISLLSRFFLRNAKIIIREPNMPSNQISLLPKSTIKLVKLIYPFADRVIAQTEEMRQEIIDIYRINPVRVQTLINPINTQLIEDSLKDSSNPYSNAQFNVVAVGSLIKRKGFDILINSFKNVVQSFHDAHLYILGKGIEEENLKQQTEAVGLSQNIHFLGFQDNPYRFLMYADLFVLSSREEGLPNVVLESLYLHTKVVVTDCVSYISNLITDYHLGEVVEIDNAGDMSLKIIKTLTEEYNLLNHNISSDYNKYFKEILNDI